MKVSRQVVILTLILYAAICVGFSFHNHLAEQPSSHCSICQAMHAPGYTLAVAVHDPIFVALPICFLVILAPVLMLLVSPNSQRAPPSL